MDGWRHLLVYNDDMLPFLPRFLDILRVCDGSQNNPLNAHKEADFILSMWLINLEQQQQSALGVKFNTIFIARQKRYWRNSVVDDAILLLGIWAGSLEGLQWRMLWARSPQGPSPWRTAYKLRAEIAWPEGGA
jgi:hypothetical protein